jgi:RNA polymerase sigma factor (sigma-70 family)
MDQTELMAPPMRRQYTNTAVTAPGQPLIGIDPANVDRILSLSRRQAVLAGLIGEDVEDCAIEFVEHILCSVPQREHDPRFGYSLAWLHVCARNHAVDFRRHVSRRDMHLISWAEAEEARHRQSVWQYSLATPLAVLLHREIWEMLELGLAELRTEVKDLVLRRYVYEERLRELAEGTGRSEQAVEQQIRRARLRLRTLLEQQGITEHTLRNCLTER